MRLIDQQFLETPWYGSRQMVRWLQRQGHSVGWHHVHPNAAWVPLFGRHHGLGNAEGIGVATVEYHGCRVLPGSPRRGDGPLRQAGDFQRRSGLAVHPLPDFIRLYPKAKNPGIGKLTAKSIKDFDWCHVLPQFC
jgi:hypothetical protein